MIQIQCDRALAQYPLNSVKSCGCRGVAVGCRAGMSWRGGLGESAAGYGVDRRINGCKIHDNTSFSSNKISSDFYKCTAHAYKAVLLILDLNRMKL